MIKHPPKHITALPRAQAIHSFPPRSMNLPFIAASAFHLHSRDLDVVHGDLDFSAFLVPVITACNRWADYRNDVCKVKS